jgi:SAM-dependent methyltransferase
MIGTPLRSLINPVRRLYGRLAIGPAQFNRDHPLSLEYGYDRGTPIDRYYIEDFLAANASDIRGRVLEVGDNSYSRRFGGERVTKQDVLHVHPHAKATIVGDVTDPGTLPSAAFDCIIFVQTLHLIYDMTTALRELRRALRPGGLLLITVPGVSSVDRGQWGNSWYWSLTQLSVERLLLQSFDSAHVSVQTFGNLFAATAFLHGACVEEVDAEKLKPLDEAYPVTIAASARAH